MPQGYRGSFTHTRDQHFISGRVMMNGSSAFATTYGNDFVATRTGAGTATIKMTVPAAAYLLDFRCQRSMNALARREIVVLGVALNADGTWTATINNTDATPAAQEFDAANTNAWFSFTAVFAPTATV